MFLMNVMMKLMKGVLHHQLALYRGLTMMLCCLSLFWSSIVFADSSQQRRAAYYRYYDNGIATVSKSVSPTHIRRGYEALDSNMYLIYKVPPYNAEEDLRQERTRAAQSEQQRKDNQLKRSYRNVAYATEKKEESLNVIQKQITQQYQRMTQLQGDRNKYLKQKSDYILNKKPVPESLQTFLNNNEAHIKNTRKSIEQLKSAYAQQEQHFDYIISRLQRME